jgi:hypothetical protein
MPDCLSLSGRSEPEQANPIEASDCASQACGFGLPTSWKNCCAVQSGKPESRMGGSLSACTEVK